MLNALGIVAAIGFVAGLCWWQLWRSTGRDRYRTLFELCWGIAGGALAAALWLLFYN